MPQKISGSEIVDLGIAIERNGKAFYSALSIAAFDGEVRKTFEFLAKQEDAHIRIFESLRQQSIHQNELQNYNEEYFAYIRALAQDCVFAQNGQGEIIAAGIKSQADALTQAIGFEKDSIILYQELKKFVAAKDSEIVDNLIMQEQKHMRLLIELKKKTQ